MKSKKTINLIIATVIFFTLAFLFRTPSALAQNPIEVRGLHLNMSKYNAAVVTDFVLNEAKTEGVNTIVLQINYDYSWQKHPELANSNSITRDQLVAFADACRQSGIRLIPGMQFMSHQKCHGIDKLLDVYPYLDANPGVPTVRDYCRSWNTLHPELHSITLDLMDELLEVTGADAFHIGMDEAFMMPGQGTPYYNGEAWAKMFADEVTLYRDHLALSGRTVWMWGDRLLKASDWGVGDWEADGGTGANAIYPALSSLPKDVMINDWHYNTAPASAIYFASNGFNVTSSPWRNTGVALNQMDMMRNASMNIAPQMKGMFHTIWRNAGTFISVYRNQQPEPIEVGVKETVAVFRSLFAAIRNSGPAAAMPTINPRGGEFADPVQVIISTQTPNSEIRYTTDSTEPKANSTLYGGPLTISAPKILKAKTFASGHSPSPPTTAWFTDGQFYPQCSDEVDNDNDGRCDYSGCGEMPADSLGCNSPSDNDETDPPPPEGLIGHWRFDESSGSLAQDSSGNGNTGTVFGTSNWVTGKFGKALNFNGNSDYVKVSHPTHDLSKNLTLAFWMNGENIGSSRINPLDKDFGGEFALTIEPDKRLKYYHGQGTSTGYYFDWEAFPANTLADDGLWHHVVIVRDNSVKTLQAYYDGILKNSASYTINPSVKNSKDIFIGDGYAYPFKGLLDDVKIYNKALSQAEVEALHNIINNPADVNGDGSVNIKDIQICIKAITAPGLIPSEHLQRCKELAPPDFVANIKDIQVIIRAIIEG